MKIVFLVNCSNFFNSHFLKLAELALSKKYDVYIVAGNDLQKDHFETLGFKFIHIPLSRAGISFVNEINVFLKIRAILNDINPDIVHAFTVKPVIYSGLVCKTLKLENLKLKVFSITGLGTLAMSQHWISKLGWRILLKVYSFIFSCDNSAVIFENDDDMQYFVDEKVLKTDMAYVINGAGIDTSVFVPSSNKPKIITVVLIARLLRDKGILEYIEAGKILKSRKVNVNLQLVGSVDKQNRTSLTRDVISDAEDKGYIEYLGQSFDVKSIYQQAHIACLPSYREGRPKSLIEAASCGVAIITTDVPGCRQMVSNFNNGILVPPKKSTLLANAIEYLVLRPELIMLMGRNSRTSAIELYDYSIILDSFFKVYSKELK